MIEPVFKKDFEDKNDIVKEFGIDPVSLNACSILFAYYGEVCGYDGEAFVLFEQDGKLYEVNGSHCSCYGLEGQWEPEETTIDTLLYRINDGYLGSDPYTGDIFAIELKEFVNQL